MQALHLRISLVPAAVTVVVGASVTAFLVNGVRSAAATRVVLAMAAAAVVLVFLAAAYGAAAATRRVRRQLAAAVRSQDDGQRLAERGRRGDRSASHGTELLRAGERDQGASFADDPPREQQAMPQELTPALGEPDQRVEVFVNLARRMQSLVHREIQLLDDLEAKVEDPDLLKGLFIVDHLATRMRRQSESLAVLGGAVSRRQWNRPVTMHEVLRAAVAEVEQYSRVKVVPPVHGILQGGAVADVIHLIAELIENATKFSAPHTQVMLRGQAVTAGLAVEVEDRGLGMQLVDLQRMNGLLADPGLINISELLRDGRIGLFVVSALARRHGIKVQLQNNIFGGIQAVVVLPRVLVEETAKREPQRIEDQRKVLPEPVPMAAVLAPVTAHAPAMASVPAQEGGRVAAPAPVTGAGPVTGAALPRASDQPAVQDTAPGPAVAPSASPASLSARLAVHASEWDAGPAHPARSPAAPATEPLIARPPDPSERPPLPRRQAQAHLAPQLRDVPEKRNDNSPADQLPGLMAAFRRGFSHAEQEDYPPGG